MNVNVNVNVQVVKELSYGGLGALAAQRKGAKGRRMIRGEEVYTDKDRAAAVQMGHRDIKQSLRLKRHQERVHALQLPEEADGSTLLALGQYELRQGNTDIAIAFVNKVPGTARRTTVSCHLKKKMK